MLNATTINKNLNKVRTCSHDRVWTLAKRNESTIVQEHKPNDATCSNTDASKNQQQIIGKTFFFEINHRENWRMENQADALTSRSLPIRCFFISLHLPLYNSHLCSSSCCALCNMQSVDVALATSPAPDPGSLRTQTKPHQTIESKGADRCLHQRRRPLLAPPPHSLS
jgi:hypothetical protein